MNSIKDMLRWEEFRRQPANDTRAKRAAFMNRLLLDLIALDNRVVDLQRRVRYFKSLATRPRSYVKVSK